MKVPRVVVSLAAALAVAAVFVADLSAESCKLEAKRVEGNPRIVSGTNAVDYLFRQTYPQHFYMQIRDSGPVIQPTGETDFSDVISKEPENYVSKHPFKGVARLGSQQYGFVFDSAPVEKPEADEDAKPEKEGEKGEKAELAEPKVPPVERYDRLYFDLNHNGDLTDDKVLEAEGVTAPFVSSAAYASYTYPRVDLTIDVDGKKLDYSFSLRIYARSSRDYQYASASLNAAVYREGKITVGGKERRVVLVDFNSNGRFDDLFAVRDDIQSSDGRVYPSYGDMLFVDPKATSYRSAYDATTSDDQYYLAKLVNLDGKFYELTVSPAGDELTLDPSDASAGLITNPNQGYRAVVYGDQGMVKVAAGNSQEAPLPVGKWKLFAYTIDRTEIQKPEQEKADSEDKDKSNSLLESLAQALMGTATTTAQPNRSLSTLVSASATKDYEAIEVREGETTLLPFGPPYHPLVTAPYRSSSDSVSLAMDVIGSAGERCTSLVVDGGRPPKPKFVITGPDGKEVETGSFEYG